MGPPDSLYVRIFGAHTTDFLKDTVKTVKIVPLISIICEGVQSDLDRHSIVEHQPF